MTTTIDGPETARQPHSIPDPATRRAFLSMRELRDRLGIGEMTFRRMIEQGRFPRPVRLTQQRVAWRVADILAWEASRVEVG